MTIPSLPDLHAAQGELANDRIELLHSVLGTAVRRKAAVDPKLRDDPEEQARLELAVQGLQLVWVFSFLERRVGKEIWRSIKDESRRTKCEERAAGRAEHGDVVPPALPVLQHGASWEQFDVLRYARDCFAHSHTGELFPRDQENTKHFLSLAPRFPELATLEDDDVRWGSALHHHAAEFVRGFLPQVAAWVAAGGPNSAGVA